MVMSLVPSNLHFQRLPLIARLQILRYCPVKRLRSICLGPTAKGQEVLRLARATSIKSCSLMEGWQMC